MRHPIHYRGGVRSYGRRGEGSPLRERSVGYSDPQSGVAGCWSVWRQQTGDRLAIKPMELVEQYANRHKVPLPARVGGKGDLSVKYLRKDRHADIPTRAVGQESFEKHRVYT